MTAVSLRAQGQARNEAELLVDECVVFRPGSGSGDIDPGTGVEPEPDGQRIHQGPCWLKAAGSPSQATVGGDVVQVQRPRLMVPLSAPRLLRGDVVGVAMHTGREVTCTITAPIVGTFDTLARYEVEIRG